MRRPTRSSVGIMFQNNKLLTLRARKSHKQVVFATAQKLVRVMTDCGIEHPAAGQAGTQPA